MEQQLTNRDDFRVLSLDGGGSKGVYTLGVLREVEAITGAPLCEHFDLIFGTSTGAIIAALLALGYTVEDVRKHYFDLIPRVMKHRRRGRRTAALEKSIRQILPTARFEDMKTDVGIVVTNYETEKPMVFKSSLRQAHGRHATFQPGFGVSVADALLASASAFPFFERRTVQTTNQGHPEVMDGGFVANNPTLFAIADAVNAFNIPRDKIKVLSIGVGEYKEPKPSPFHRVLFRLWPFYMIKKMLGANTNTIETLRVTLFKDIACVRVNEAFPSEQYETDLLESDPKKLLKLHTLGRESFAKHEKDMRTLFGWKHQGSSNDR
jgi:predicted acylesterase/phospholipase RssA